MSSSTKCILKFGGAALATNELIETIAEIIEQKSKEIDNIAIVVSAMGKTTDQLLRMAHSINPSPPKREVDMLISVGERISMSLLAMALAKRGLKAISFTGSQSGIITSEEHSNAKIVDVRPKRIQKAFEQNVIAIVAGFQGVSTSGEITTLGRGGSDTTAVALAIALGASHVEFYKDVPGIFSEDPKKSESAFPISNATFDQVLEILQTGGRILHTRAVEMAKRHNMKLRIRSFYNSDQETIVYDEQIQPPFESNYE